MGEFITGFLGSLQGATELCHRRAWGLQGSLRPRADTLGGTALPNPHQGVRKHGAECCRTKPQPQHPDSGESRQPLPASAHRR